MSAGNEREFIDHLQAKEAEKDKCIFCGSEEEVRLVPVDTPNNLQPVCIGCYEGFLDACRAG